MENILQAVERARAGRPDPANEASVRTDRSTAQEFQRGRVVELNQNLLRSRRIVAQDSKDPDARAFDILRTQVLRTMDMRKMQFLAVTSPTAGCGKTVTAINLALSIARYPDRPVLLIDMDFKKPQVAGCLGLEFDNDLLAVRHRRALLSDGVIETRVGDNALMILPTGAVASGSAELLASRELGDVLQQIKRDYPSAIVVIDLPPVLTGDDVLAILPQVDGVLLVAAAGITTPSEIEECSKQLHSAEIVRVVLNKAQELATSSYY